MIRAIAALIGFLGLGQPAQIEQKTFNLKDWRVTVSQDRFTGAVSCRAIGHGMILSSGSVVFKFGRGVDTSNAVYRLDLGPAFSVGDQAVNQELRHIVETGAPLDNPSAGFVALPLSALAGVRRVDIRANVSSTPQTFDVTRLPAVLQFETARACFTGEDLRRSALTSAPTATRTPN